MVIAYNNSGVMVSILCVSLLATGCSAPKKEQANDVSVGTEVSHEQSIVSHKESNQDKKALKYTIDQFTDAVLSNDQALVKKMLKSGYIDINTKNSDGDYPLEVSLILENIEMADLLLQNGADANLKTNCGKSVKELVLKNGSRAMKDLFTAS